MKLGTSSEDLPDLLLTRLDFNEKYGHSSSEAEEITNPKVVVKLPFRGENYLGPSFSDVYCFLPDFSFRPQFR
jgi:hypothetical protein